MVNLPQTLNNRWHTTFSCLKHSREKELHSLINAISSKYVIVKEFGESGTNEHFHAYYVSDKYARGDRYTGYFKDAGLYADFKKYNRKTMKTVPVTDDPKIFISFYFFKEGNTLDDIISKGFSEKDLEEIYANRVLKMKAKKILKLHQAPEIIYNRMLVEDLDHPDAWVQSMGSYELCSWMFREMLISLNNEYYTTALWKQENEICKAIYIEACSKRRREKYFEDIEQEIKPPVIEEFFSK